MIDILLLNTLRNKKRFVSNISKAISYDCGEIIDVRYEAFIKDGGVEPKEYIIITFRGGNYLVRNVHMNSHPAILAEIGKYSTGGYYAEVRDYDELCNDPSWHQIDL